MVQVSIPGAGNEKCQVMRPREPEFVIIHLLDVIRSTLQMQSSVLAVAASIPAAGIFTATPPAASASGRANDHARDTKVCDGKVSISCHSTLLSLERTLPPCLIRSISLMSSKKHAPDAVIVVAGSGKAKKMKGAVKSAPVATDKGDALAKLEAW